MAAVYHGLKPTVTYAVPITAGYPPPQYPLLANRSDRNMGLSARHFKELSVVRQSSISACPSDGRGRARGTAKSCHSPLLACFVYTAEHFGSRLVYCNVYSAVGREP
jgi:hypothetical protein